MFRALAAALLLVILTALNAGAQEFEIPSVTISGGDLANPIRLAPADADAFRRRINQLPRFEDPPTLEGPSYVVTTSYWPVAVRLDEDEGEDVLDVDVRGDYYPLGGFVRVTVGEEEGVDAWMALNLRQRAILDRYIRLSLAGEVDNEPSTIDVLTAMSSTEVFGVEVGPKVLDLEAGVDLLGKLREENPSPILQERELPSIDESGVWLIVTLLEGRSLRYYYSQGVLTEALGTERYDATAIADILEGIAPEQAATIVQDEPAGSLLWWPVTIGGGLAAIGAAIWLQRKSAS